MAAIPLNAGATVSATAAASTANPSAPAPLPDPGQTGPVPTTSVPPPGANKDEGSTSHFWFLLVTLIAGFAFSLLIAVTEPKSSFVRGLKIMLGAWAHIVMIVIGFWILVQGAPGLSLFPFTRHNDG